MLWFWIIYALIVIGILLWGGLIGLRFTGTLQAAPLPPVLPTVSTVVPARNEERNIGRCVRGLTRQDYPRLELIFVDDDSRDATPDILASHARHDARIRVVQTGGKPDSWNGKQWACYSGAQVAGGDWLCFMDADTYAEPALISRTLAFAEAHRIDFLTLQPWYELYGLWERIILPAGLLPLLFVFPPHRVNNPRDNLVMANGQFILVRRSVYEAVGGHAAVRDCLMDDFSLAEKVHRAGYRLHIVDGRQVMRVRLYTNLREIWAGALKASIDLTGGWLASLLLLLFNLTVNIAPAAVLLGALFTGDIPVALVMGATVAFQMVYYGLIRMAGFGAPPWSGVTYPLGSLLATAILLDGMFRVASGREIRWKDRPVLGARSLRLGRVRARSNGET